MAAIRRSPKHINIQRLIDLVQSKQSRNVEGLATKKHTHMDDSMSKCPVKLQINSFMTQKEEKQKRHRQGHNNNQDTSGDSTATNTIPSAHVPHGALRLAWANSKTKHPDAEAVVVHLSKSPLKSGLTACIRRSVRPAGGKSGEKVAASFCKYSKTPERTRVAAHRNPSGNAQTSSAHFRRNKTPSVRIALGQTVTATGQPPPPQPRHHSSSRRACEAAAKGLLALPAGGQIRSRNQRPLEGANNELVVRTKPEEGNVPMAAAQQMLLSTRKDGAEYGERRGSAPKVHALHARSHYRTLYPTVKAKGGRPGDGGSPKDLRLAVLSAFQDEVRSRLKEAKKEQKSVADTSAPTISGENGAGEDQAAASDSDDCKTVIENNCDNDYSLICNSLNGVY